MQVVDAHDQGPLHLEGLHGAYSPVQDAPFRDAAAAAAVSMPNVCRSHAVPSPGLGPLMHWKARKPRGGGLTRKDGTTDGDIASEGALLVNVAACTAVGHASGSYSQKHPVLPPGAQQHLNLCMHSGPPVRGKGGQKLRCAIRRLASGREAYQQ